MNFRYGHGESTFRFPAHFHWQHFKTFPLLQVNSSGNYPTTEICTTKHNPWKSTIAQIIPLDLHTSKNKFHGFFDLIFDFDSIRFDPIWFNLIQHGWTQLKKVKKVLQNRETLSTPELWRGPMWAWGNVSNSPTVFKLTEFWWRLHTMNNSQQLEQLVHLHTPHSLSARGMKD